MSPFDRMRNRLAREQAVRDRNAAVRRDIGMGKRRGWIMLEYGLSITAYEQLASQERGPRGAWRAA